MERNAKRTLLGFVAYRSLHTAVFFITLVAVFISPADATSTLSRDNMINDLVAALQYYTKYKGLVFDHLSEDRVSYTTSHTQHFEGIAPEKLFHRPFEAGHGEEIGYTNFQPPNEVSAKENIYCIKRRSTVAFDDKGTENVSATHWVWIPKEVCTREYQASSVSRSLEEIEGSFRSHRLAYRKILSFMRDHTSLSTNVEVWHNVSEALTRAGCLAHAGAVLAAKAARLFSLLSYAGVDNAVAGGGQHSGIAVLDVPASGARVLALRNFFIATTAAANAAAHAYIGAIVLTDASRIRAFRRLYRAFAGARDAARMALANVGYEEFEATMRAGTESYAASTDSLIYLYDAAESLMTELAEFLGAFRRVSEKAHELIGESLFDADYIALEEWEAIAKYPESSIRKHMIYQSEAISWYWREEARRDYFISRAVLCVSATEQHRATTATIPSDCIYAYGDSTLLSDLQSGGLTGDMCNR